MVEAAHGTAADIERRAQDAADGKRSEVRAKAEAALEDIRAIELELTALLRSVSAEADGLRAKLDRAQIRSAPSDQAFARQELTTGEHAVDVHAESFLEEELAEPESASEARHEPGDDTSQEAAEGPEDTEPPAEESGSDPVEFEVGDLPEAPAVADPSPAGTDDELRAQVAATTDVGLAELYQTATSKESGTAASDADAEYWQNLARLTLEEAVGRPEFGQQSEDEGGGGRREKKQRLRTLRPLMEARNRALQDSEQRG